jgi:hypothetical protein
VRGDVLSLHSPEEPQDVASLSSYGLIRLSESEVCESEESVPACHGNDPFSLCLFSFNWNVGWITVNLLRVSNYMEQGPPRQADSRSTGRLLLEPELFKRACHWTLSWASGTESTPTHCISLSIILILSSHLRLCLPSGLFFSLKVFRLKSCTHVSSLTSVPCECSQQIISNGPKIICALLYPLRILIRNVNCWRACRYFDTHCINR